MKINGIQKMTLLDYPGRVACVIFTGVCDFRCPFCHNSELLDGTAPEVMTRDELIAFLKTRTALLDGVVITGGEPLIDRSVKELLRDIKSLGYDIKIDTNGNHPELLKEIVAEGLADYVAMDIKNSPERYAVTAGIENPAWDISRVRESVELLKEGHVAYEFRTTVCEQLHDIDSFRVIGPWLEGAEAYYLQPFVDRDTVKYDGFTAPSDVQLDEYCDTLRPFVPSVSVRGR